MPVWVGISIFIAAEVHNDKHIFDVGQPLKAVAHFRFASCMNVKAESAHSGASFSCCENGRFK